MTPCSVRFGESGSGATLDLTILGLRYPDVAEPEGLDLVDLQIGIAAPPVGALFDMLVRIEDLRSLAGYLRSIASGNGPHAMIALADGLLELRFAPSRRGPVLLGVTLKSVDVAHLRVEYLVTLEPRHLGRALGALESAIVQANIR